MLMTANKRRFKAEIDGRTYTIIGTASDRHMQTVTRMMNEQVAQLKKLAPDLSDTEDCDVARIQCDFRSG